MGAYSLDTYIMKTHFKKIVSGAALAFLLSAGAVAAQSTTSTTSVPGTPDTGAGGTSTLNLVLLGGSAAVALVGAMLLARKRSL